MKKLNVKRTNGADVLIVAGWITVLVESRVATEVHYLYDRH